MDDLEFVIPLNSQELTDRSDGYYVQEIFEPSHIDKKLEDCAADFRDEGPMVIYKTFDTFYSVLHHISRLKSNIIETAWELLIKNFATHLRALPMILDPEGIDVQLRTQQLNALKMEAYILTRFVDEFESDAAKPGAGSVSGAGKKTKGTKKFSEDDFDWASERMIMLKAVNDLMQLEIQRLWNPPVVEEQFTELFSSICYKMLENQNVVRQTEARDLIFHILGKLIKRFKHRLGACLKIFQLLQHFEHLVSPLACAMEIFANQYGAKILVGDVMREIGSMGGSDMSRDLTATKSFSQFIIEIATKIPEFVLPNISLLMVHLDGESYTMRNGVLGVFGEIIAKVLSKEDLDDTMKKARESLLTTLEDHIHDVNAFVRSKCIQIWIQLFQQKIVPLARQGAVVDLIIGRLRDKAANVRKYSVQFLKVALTSNPYGAKLTTKLLAETLDKEVTKLAEMEPKRDERVEIPLVDVDWSKKKKTLRAALQIFVSDENMEESEELDLYEDNENPIHKVKLQIQTYLKEEEYQKGIRLLCAAKDKWSEKDEFQVNEGRLYLVEAEDDKEGSSTENSENIHAEKENSEGIQIPDSVEAAEKRRRIASYEVLLESIYKMDQLESGQPSDTTEKDKDSQSGGQAIDEAIIEATQKPENEDNILLARQRELVTYLKACLYFSQQMNHAIPVLCQLLGSKSSSDVLEIIDFFIVAHEFGLAQSEAGIRKMANLIWSNDPVIKKAVVAAFERLYIDIACDNPRNKPTLIVQSLMSLLTNANLGELTSLEELVCELMKMELIPQSVINLLWSKFSLKVTGTTLQEQRASVVLLSMIAGAEKDIIKTNLSILIEHGLAEKENLYLARDTCAAILKLTEKKRGPGGGNSMAEPFRLAPEHQLFSRLEVMMIQHLPFINDVSWTPFCEQAIMVIYNLAESPDSICGRLLKCMLRLLMTPTGSTNPQTVGKDANMDDIFPKENEAEGETGDNSDGELKKHPKVVARVLFAAGQVALLQLFHLDVSIFSEMKRRHRIKEEEKEKKGQKTTSRKSTSNNTVEESASKTSSKVQQESALDDEMGVGGAVAEDAEAEYIRKVCENDVVTGSNLLACLTPLIVNICSNRAKYNSPELQSAAALALAKYMLVSSQFCNDHIQLLFTILEKSELIHVRSNIIIALGDLTLRFPNLIEPWTPHLYARLRDESMEVRKTTVTILSHLILNDMVKVKGQISEMAVCLEDSNEKISNLAKMFFFELGQKGNALYNVAPDIISRLSDPQSGVEEKTFRSIMKYLLQFIQKDKQGESLVEKLCHRFRTTKTDRQNRDLSYCLSVLPYNEKAFKKLQENIACYRTFLVDQDVHVNFTTILTTSRKFCKPELKAMIDEFEKLVDGYHTKTIDENVDPETAANILTDATNVNTNEPTEKTKGKKPPRKTNARQKKSNRKRHDDSDDSDADVENRQPTVKAGSKRPTRQKAGKVAARNQVFSSGDEDDVFD